MAAKPDDNLYRRKSTTARIRIDADIRSLVSTIVACEKAGIECEHLRKELRYEAKQATRLLVVRKPDPGQSDR